MFPNLRFSHAKRPININTSIEINKIGELIMTDGDLDNIRERHIARPVLLDLLKTNDIKNWHKPIPGHDFTIEELGTNASQEMRRFRVTIRPPYAVVAITTLKAGYGIEESEIKGLENLQ